MKKRHLALLFMLLSVLLLFSSGKADAASLKAKKLSKNKTYSIDLNGGKKEKVKWTVKDLGDDNQQFRLYVNGKMVWYKTIEDHGVVAGVKALDMNTSNKYTELLVDFEGEMSTYGVFMLRYNSPKKVTAITSFANYKDNMSPANIGRIDSGNYKNTGKNKLYLTNETPYMNMNFGCFYILAPVKLKSSKMTFIKESQYKLANVKNYTPDLFGGAYYKLKKDMTLYKTASFKKELGTVEAGDTFVPSYIKPMEPVGYEIEDETYYYHPLFVKVKTDDGRTGWLYFPARTESGDYNSDYLTATPSWG